MEYTRKEAKPCIRRSDQRGYLGNKPATGSYAIPEMGDEEFIANYTRTIVNSAMEGLLKNFNGEIPKKFDVHVDNHIALKNTHSRFKSKKTLKEYLYGLIDFSGLSVYKMNIVKSVLDETIEKYDPNTNSHNKNTDPVM